MFFFNFWFYNVSGNFWEIKVLCIKEICLYCLFFKFVESVLSMFIVDLNGIEEFCIVEIILIVLFGFFLVFFIFLIVIIMRYFKFKIKGMNRNMLYVFVY